MEYIYWKGLGKGQWKTVSHVLPVDVCTLNS